MNNDPGRFDIESFTLINQHRNAVDIRNFVTSFTLIESIFNKFVMAEVKIVDTMDIIKNYRLSGQEFVRISIAQKEGFDESAEKKYSIDKTFRLYKIKNYAKDETGKPASAYTMYLCDPRMFYCKTTRISKVYRGTWSDMLSKALTDSDIGNFREEEFDHWDLTETQNIQFVVPNWTLGKFIDYIVNNADPVNSDRTFRNSSFFYQSLNGGFRFKSFAEMCKSEFPVVFDDTPRVGHDYTEISANAPGGVNSKIQKFGKPQIFDTFRGTTAGAYASEMKVIDTNTKRTFTQQFGLDEAFASEGEHISKEPLLVLDQDETFVTADTTFTIDETHSIKEIDIDLPANKRFSAVTLYDTHTSHIFDNGEPNESEEWKGNKNNNNHRLHRRALLEMLDQHKVAVVVPLRTDLSVGHIIELSISPTEVTREDSQVDQLNDNRYLITDLDVVGSARNGVGVCKMFVVKESLAKKLTEINPLENAKSGGLLSSTGGVG